MIQLLPTSKRDDLNSQSFFFRFSPEVGIKEVFMRIITFVLSPVHSFSIRSANSSIAGSRSEANLVVRSLYQKLRTGEESNFPEISLVRDLMLLSVRTVSTFFYEHTDVARVQPYLRTHFDMGLREEL